LQEDRGLQPTRVRYLVLASLCLAAMLAYIPRNCLGVAEKDIRSELGLSEFEMGWVMSAFFITYAAFQIPTGWLGHVWGTRLALTLFAVLWSVFGGLASLATGMTVLLLARLGMGVAQAGLFPCTTTSLAKWFPATRRGLVNGLLGSSMQVGAVIAPLLAGLLLDPLGWQWLLVLCAVPGTAWAVWFFGLFRDHPEEHPDVNEAERALIRGPQATPTEEEPPGRPEPTPWKALFTSRAMLWICGQQFFRAAGYMLFASWFATFLKETRDVSNRQAGILTSIPICAYVLGSGIGGLVSDWVLVRTGSRRQSRQGLSVVSSLACALLMIGAYFIHNVWLAALVITGAAFCAAIGGPCAYALTIDMGGKHVPAVFATMNMAGNIGAAVFPLLVPPLVKGTGDWNAVLLLVAGIYIASATCWTLFDSNGTIFAPPQRPSAEEKQ